MSMSNKYLFLLALFLLYTMTSNYKITFKYLFRVRGGANMGGSHHKAPLMSYFKLKFDFLKFFHVLCAQPQGERRKFPRTVGERWKFLGCSQGQPTVPWPFPIGGMVWGHFPHPGRHSKNVTQPSPKKGTTGKHLPRRSQVPKKRELWERLFQEGEHVLVEHCCQLI